MNILQLYLIFVIEMLESCDSLSYYLYIGKDISTFIFDIDTSNTQ